MKVYWNGVELTNVLKVTWVRMVNDIGGAEIILDDPGRGLVGTWKDRVGVWWLSVAYDTGELCWAGRVEDVESPNVNTLKLICTSLLGGLMDGAVTFDYTLEKGTVLAATNPYVRPSFTITDNEYNGYYMQFTELTPPSNYATMTPTGTASFTWYRSDTDQTSSAYILVTGNVSDLSDIGANFQNVSWSPWISQLAFGYAYKNPGVGFALNIAYDFAMSNIGGNDANFPLAVDTLSYGGFVSTYYGGGGTYGVIRRPYGSLWNYPSSKWDTVFTGFGVAQTNMKANYKIPLEFQEKYVSSNEAARVQISAAIICSSECYYTLPYLSCQVSNDYVGLYTQYAAATRFMVCSPNCITMCSYAASTGLSYLYTDGAPVTSGNLDDGDGVEIVASQYDILFGEKDGIPSLRPYYVFGHLDITNALIGCGRNVRGMRPFELLASLAEDARYYFWEELVPTTGVASVPDSLKGSTTLHYKSAFNNNAASISDDDIDPTATPSFAYRNKKYGAVVVNGAEKRFGSLTRCMYAVAPTNLSTIPTTLSGKVLVYNDNQIGSDTEAIQKAAKLFDFYKDDAVALVLSLNSTSTTRALQPGELVDVLLQELAASATISLANQPLWWMQAEQVTGENLNLKVKIGRGDMPE